MAKTKEMEHFLDILAHAAFGRGRNDGVCVTCGSDKINPVDFRNELSWREYNISRMCQVCQDKIFE